MMSDMWLTMNAAAAHLGVSRDTVYRLIDSGRLAGHRLAGVRGYRFRVEELDALAEPAGKAAPNGRKAPAKAPPTKTAKQAPTKRPPSPPVRRRRSGEI